MKHALLVLAMIGPATAALAQAGPAGAGQAEVAPRSPGAAEAGASPASQHRMNDTVDGIDQHLLNAEKDRPNLPGQTPSPSQTAPGGTASASRTAPGGAVSSSGAPRPR